MAAKKQDPVTDPADSADAPAVNQAASEGVAAAIQTPAADQAPEVDPAANEQTVFVRFLIDHLVDGKPNPCNSVAEFPASVAAALVRGGIADDNPEAVAAAK